MVLMLPALGLGQDLSNLEEGPNFKISGGLNVNQVFYATTSDNPRRDPYNYFLGGNLALSLYGLSIPVSFSYSNQNFSYNQPFNQYGLQPTYKWVRGYIGYNSLSFSKYTLAGHIFNGVGVELTPDIPISATVMYGRLRKAVPLGSEDNGGQPSFKRLGWGVKVAYTPNGDQYELSLFGAWDDVESLLLSPQDTLPPNLDPQQNIALGLLIRKSLGSVLNLEVEYGSSSLTRNVLSPIIEGPLGEVRWQPAAWLGVFNPRRPTTSFYQAVRGNLNANLKVVTLGIGYERIDPGYATLGAYFFNADLENFTANVSTALFENKINLAVNVGGQRNNLNQVQAINTARGVGSAQISAQVSPRVSLNLNYSNFQTFARAQSQDQFGYINSLSQFDSVNVDTLSFVQVNQSGSLSVSYVLSTNKEHPMTLVANGTYSATGTSGAETAAGATFYNMSGAYSYKHAAWGLGLTLAGNATITFQDTIRSMQYGPTLSANQSFLDKKLKLTLSASANRAESTLQSATGWLSNFRLAGNYQLGERHQFRLNATTISRPTAAAASGRQTDFTANLGYSFSF